MAEQVRLLKNTLFQALKIDVHSYYCVLKLSFMMPGQTNQLSIEKKAIAELEDVVAERIFHFKDMPSLTECNSIDTFEPMEEFCKTLFSKIQPVVDPSASQMNAAQALALLGTNSTES